MKFMKYNAIAFFFLLTLGIGFSTTPVMNTSRIIPTTAYANDTLIGYCNATDANTSHNLTYEYELYKNGSLFSNGTSFSSSTCYQEHANITNQSGTDGSCNLNYTGTYANDSGWEFGVTKTFPNTIDGSWSTYGSGQGVTAYGWVNYTKPTISNSSQLSALWQIKTYESGMLNVSIPTNCTEQSVLILQFQSKIEGGLDDGVLYYCYDGSGWYKIYNQTTSPSSNRVYEEGIFWNITSGTFAQGIEVNTTQVLSSNLTKGQNWTLSCRAYDGTNYSSWLNSSTLTISNSTPNTTSARIAPTTAYSNDTLIGYCNGTSMDNSNLTYDYKWYLNGSLYTGGTGLWCYQETATTATACGGVNTGTYSNTAGWYGADSFNAVIDGNWSSYSRSNTNNGGSCTFNSTGFINYTKPTGATNLSLWEIKTQLVNTNLSIPVACWNGNQNTMIFKVNSGFCDIPTGYFTELSCFDSSNWVVMNKSNNSAGLDTMNIYEEAMRWNIGINTTTQATEIGLGTILSSALTVGQNWTFSCQASVGTEYASWVNSSVKTITKILPHDAAIGTIVNSSLQHAFLINASAISEYGGTDFVASNVSSTLGTCSPVSNSTSGNNFYIQYNCSTTSPGATNVTIGFTDSSSNYISATNENSYPDHVSSLTPPSVITPIYINSTATCTAGTYADSDGEIENVSSRTWAWYKNGAIQAGQSATTLVLSAVTAVKGDNISCWENTTNSTWIGSFASNMSSNVTVSNSVPVNATVDTFVDATASHSFIVNGTVEDIDGGTDIVTTNASATLGTCTQTSNNTANNYFYVTYNCTTTTPGATVVTIGFTDGGSAYTSAAGASHVYLDHGVTLGAPTITPDPAYVNTSLTCNAGVWTDADGDTVGTYAWKWFKNGNLIAGQTLSTLGTGQFLKSDSIVCEETATATTWTNSTNVTNSSALVISNSLPVTQSVRINPNTTVYANSTIMGYCNASDIDGDVLSYNYEWFKNGASNASGNLGSFAQGLEINVANKTGMTKGQNWSFSCSGYDGASSTTLYTSNVTISNSAPYISTQTMFANDSASHSFIVSAVVTDVDGGSDIVADNISSTLGTCTKVANVTAGNTFNQSWNCSSTSSGSTNIVIGFTDASGSYIGTTLKSNSYPNNIPSVTISAASNGSAGHYFSYTTNISDLDGLTDLNYTRSSTLGTCSHVSNTTNSTHISIIMNCTSTSPGSSIVKTNATDLFGITSQANFTNAYPNNNPSLTVPSIDPASPSVSSTLTCVNGSLIDVDGDTENTTARTWKWYQNNSLIAGQTSSTLANTSFGNSDIINCEETTTNSTWSGSATNNSSQVIIHGNSPVINLNAIYNSSGATGTTFYANNQLYGYINVSDFQAINITSKWFRNGVANNTNSLDGATPNTLINIDNIFASDVTKGVNWTLEITVAGLYGNTSSNSTMRTISNSAPVNATIANITNATVTGHWFTFNATVGDNDGGADISSWYVTVSSGACVVVSNTTTGVEKSVAYNCTGTTGSTSFNVTFTDASGASVKTATYSNSYPNHAPSTTVPTITPATAYKSNTLTCNAGTFSDPDSDTAGTHTWKWFNDSGLIAGQTASTLASTYFNKGSNVTCEQTPVDQYSLSGDANNSTAKLISNSAPTISSNITITNASTSHSFTATAIATDADGGADIVSVFITNSSGSCVQTSNTTGSSTFSVTYNCSATSPSTPVINITFNDSSGSSVTTPSVTNAFIDHAPNLTGVNITPAVAYTNSLLTCNPGVFADADSDTENTSARTWKWFNGSSAIAGQTAATLASTNFVQGDSIKCEETTTNTTWTATTSKNSSAVVIGNALSITSATIYNASSGSGTLFYVNYTLYGFTYVTDIVVVNVSGKWYKNGINTKNFSITDMAANVSVNVDNYTDAVAKGDNMTLEITATGSAPATALNSSVRTISNSIPVVNVSLAFTNSTSIHSFNATATVTDADGKTDIVATNISTSYGTCTYLTNSSSGYNFNATYNCTSTKQGSSNITIGFTDSSGAYVQSSASNSYPATPALTVPIVTPTNPTVESALNCTDGNYSDAGGSTENTTNRSWIWYKNGAALNATSETITLETYNITKGSNMSCKKTTSGLNWTSFQVSNMSANVTVNNTPPVPALPISTYTASDNIKVNCSATDVNGGADIVSVTAVPTNGTAAQLENGSSGNSFWASWNITGLFSSQSINVTCSFNDTDGGYATSSIASFTTTNGDSYGTETQSGNAYINSTIKWVQSYTTVGAVHACSYMPIHSDFTTATNASVMDNTSANITSTTNASGIFWSCSGVNSPYILTFYTNPVIVNSTNVSGGLGNNQMEYKIQPNTTLGFSLDFRFSFGHDTTNRKLWKCILNNFTTCDSGDASLWTQQSYTETDMNTSYLGSKVFSLLYPEMMYVTTNDGSGGSGPVAGGGGGTTIVYPDQNQSNIISGSNPKAFEIFNDIGNFIGNIYKWFKDESPLGLAWFWLPIALFTVGAIFKLQSKKIQDKALGSVFFVLAALLFIVFVGVSI